MKLTEMMIECTTDSTSDSMRLTDEEIDKIINSEKSKSLQDPYGFSVVNKQIENLPRFPLVPRIMKILRIRAFILMLIQVETKLKNKESKIKLTM